MEFEFATATRILFGPGKLRETASLVKGLGERALLVTGKNIERSAPLRDLLKKNSIECVCFAVEGEPEISTVQNGVALARRERCEFVMGVGGGSALDAGKAIAAMLANDGDVLDYLEIIGRGRPLTKPSLPFIAIPTTAGTGSEVTRNAVLASTEQRVKVSLRSPLMLPRVALVDPELTCGMPPDVTARTGLDALTQLIEPYVCTRANPLTDLLCIEGLGRAARSLRGAFENGANLAAREDMALASLFGGLALSNSGLGAVHGFAGPMGGVFPGPHGALCGALLPHVMAANLRALRERHPSSAALKRYEHIARLLTGNPAATADDGVQWTRELVADLNTPRLSAYGITKGNFAELTEKAERANSMKANPIGLTAKELGQILENAL